MGVLEAFRTFIYDGQVNGVSDGIQIVAHDSTTKGMLDSKRYTGAVGGFGGGLINGSVKQSAVTNLNSVTGVNYVGGFIGHLGKSGTVAADNAQLGTDALNLLGATAAYLTSGARTLAIRASPASRTVIPSPPHTMATITAKPPTRLPDARSQAVLLDTRIWPG